MEEVLRTRVPVLLRLIDFVPDIAHILIDDLSVLLKVVASVIEISEDKE